MGIEQAVRIILGNKIAGGIIAEQGIHWAVVAAMCKAKANEDPRALAAIRKWNDDQKGGA